MIPSIIWAMIGFALGSASIAGCLRDAFRDANRYRWIRRSRNYDIRATSRSLDAAIDAAIARDREVG